MAMAINGIECHSMMGQYHSVPAEKHIMNQLVLQILNVCLWFDPFRGCCFGGVGFKG